MADEGSMRAVVFDRYGGPDVLEMRTIERPVPRSGTILIRVAYAGVNPADWKAREGWLSRYFDYQFPFVLGFDAAGVVAGIGEGVEGFKIGQRVVATSNQGKGERGSYAQFTLADAERVVKLPDHVSLQDAAAMPTAAITAYEALFDVGKTQSGSVVLINGGAGGAGSYAIQLAHAAGARVAATCGPSNIDYVRSLGADLAIDYRQGGILEAVRHWAPDGVDLVVDAVGQGSLLGSIEIVRRGGIVAPIATLISDEPMPDPERAAELGVTIRPTIANFENQSRQIHALVDAVASGSIRAPAIEVMGLESASEAQQHVRAGHVRGKIVLAVDTEMGA